MSGLVGLPGTRRSRFRNADFILGLRAVYTPLCAGGHFSGIQTSQTAELAPGQGGAPAAATLAQCYICLPDAIFGVARSESPVPLSRRGLCAGGYCGNSSHWLRRPLPTAPDRALRKCRCTRAGALMCEGHGMCVTYIGEAGGAWCWRWCVPDF